MVDKTIFKAYDIRGVYPSQLNEETAYRIGRAYTKFIKREYAQGVPAGGNTEKEKLQIVIGADMRLSSPTLKEKLIKGVIDEGANVIDLGLVSTPTFYFAVAFYGYDGGILTTASHNPKEYNGFKMVRHNALPVSGNTGITEIRNMVVENNFAEVDESIKGEIILKQNVLQEQMKEELKYGNIEKIKPFKIVVDTANGMGALYIEELFKEIPCELVKLNFDLDGSFPAHEADPLKEENKEQLKQKVLEEKADLGITTDGDGDRVFFVDDKGQSIDQPIIRGLLAKIFLQETPNAKIGYDIRPGRVTRDMILENGGVPVLTRVGHSLIKEQSIKEGVLFAGESSGHFFLDVKIGFYEVPVIMILKLLEYFSNINVEISEYVKQYKKYYNSGEINFTVKNPAEIAEKLEEKYSTGTINKLDGLTIEYPEFWFNVRSSNTQPLLRLNLEAVNKEIMGKKRDEVSDFIMSWK